MRVLATAMTTLVILVLLLVKAAAGGSARAAFLCLCPQYRYVRGSGQKRTELQRETALCLLLADCSLFSPLKWANCGIYETAAALLSTKQTLSLLCTLE